MTASDRPATRIDTIVRTVPDLAAAADFYCGALGFRIDQPPRYLTPDTVELLGTRGATVSGITLRLGRQKLALVRFEPAGRPYPLDSTATDLWFQHCAVVVADMEAAYRTVSSHPIAPLSIGGPQHLPPNTGGVRAFKFRDPFGHPLELLWFPPGVGDPTWQTASTALFRGIDHTAIAVSDADGSARFYRDVLGLGIAGRSLNRGPAQGRLDAVEHDEVDVVALAPAEAPPHLELLGYRAGRRRRLQDASPADASVSRTIAVVDDLDAVVAACERQAASSGTVRRGRWANRGAATFQDPDGHTWVCMAPA